MSVETIEYKFPTSVMSVNNIVKGMNQMFLRERKPVRARFNGVTLIMRKGVEPHKLIEEYWRKIGSMTEAQKADARREDFLRALREEDVLSRLDYTFKNIADWLMHRVDYLLHDDASDIRHTVATRLAAELGVDLTQTLGPKPQQGGEVRYEWNVTRYLLQLTGAIPQDQHLS